MSSGLPPASTSRMKALRTGGTTPAGESISSASTRFGSEMASSHATAPPIDVPTTTACGAPTASMNRPASRA
jgi:hypothetical protein